VWKSAGVGYLLGLGCWSWNFFKICVCSSAFLAYTCDFVGGNRQHSLNCFTCLFISPERSDHDNIGETKLCIILINLLTNSTWHKRLKKAVTYFRCWLILETLLIEIGVIIASKLEPGLKYLILLTSQMVKIHVKN